MKIFQCLFSKVYCVFNPWIRIRIRIQHPTDKQPWFTRRHRPVSCQFEIHGCKGVFSQKVGLSHRNRICKIFFKYMHCLYYWVLYQLGVAVSCSIVKCVGVENISVEYFFYYLFLWKSTVKFLQKEDFCTLYCIISLESFVILSKVIKRYMSHNIFF